MSVANCSRLEWGCCPGNVIEQKTVVNKAVNVPYTYSEPTYSRQCYQTSTVDRNVLPYSTSSSPPSCETQETIIKIPTTDVQTRETPLCKQTCTTSEYVIQIPIVETTCTSSPLCSKTTRTQDNVVTTVSQRTGCSKQVCTQNQVVVTPKTDTVCQTYQGSVNRVGSRTVLKPEVIKNCVQLPPYKCLKPAVDGGDFIIGGGDNFIGGGAYGSAGSAAAAGAAAAASSGVGIGSYEVPVSYSGHYVIGDSGAAGASAFGSGYGGSASASAGAAAVSGGYYTPSSGYYGTPGPALCPCS